MAIPLDFVHMVKFVKLDYMTSSSTVGATINGVDFCSYMLLLSVFAPE